MYKPNRKIPCVYMRGGTSKAVFFHDKDLPQDAEARDRVILSAFGSPDRRQIDGMGGANTSTSKVAIIKKSERPGIDVDYDFGQVDVMAPIVGKTMNCGNISSAVGPFAIDEGLVEAVEPMTEVHIFNENTKKEIIAQVPVKDGRAVTEGDFEIDGVPGTAAKVTLKFVNPQGAASGKLLPTGNVKDYIEIEGKKYHTARLITPDLSGSLPGQFRLCIKIQGIGADHKKLPHFFLKAHLTDHPVNHLLDQDFIRAFLFGFGAFPL